MTLGDHHLKVQKASVGITQVAGEINVNAMSMLAGTTSIDPEVSRVLQLLNMVTPDELMDNDDYEGMPSSLSFQFIHPMESMLTDSKQKLRKTLRASVRNMERSSPSRFPDLLVEAEIQLESARSTSSTTRLSLLPRPCVHWQVESSRIAPLSRRISPR